MFLVYKTDDWHSYNSRDIIGLASDRAYAMLLCKEKAKEEGCEISGDQEWNLGNLEQTQGYDGDGEFQYEEIDVDTLL